MKKFNIEDYLHKLDIALNQKPKREIYMLYIMIFGSIFAFSYLMFWDTSFDSFNNKLQKIADIKLKIQDDQRYLRLNGEDALVRLDRKIKQNQEDYIKYQDYNQYVKTQMESISFLFYDEGVWGDFLNSIDNKAKRNKVTILELTNTINDESAAFGHVMDISLHTQGKYKDVLKFINELEESELVVDVHDINISANDFLESNIQISVWGIKF